MAKTLPAAEDVSAQRARIAYRQRLIKRMFHRATKVSCSGIE
jgi:hypothetical protein